MTNEQQTKNKKSWFLRHKIITGVVILLFSALVLRALENAKEKAAIAPVPVVPVRSEVRQEATAETQAAAAPKEENTITENPAPVEEKKPYDELGVERNPLVTNYYYLIDASKMTEAEVEQLARDIKAGVCDRDCNISLYDDRKAYVLEQERKKLAGDFNTMGQVPQWDKENAKFLGEHVVGFLEFSSDEFLYYPNR